MAEDYDPHLYRIVKKPTNDIETLIHMLKGYFGTGILATPEAFKFAGMINGIVFTVLICYLIGYCIHMLVRSQYILCKKKRIPIMTYPESMKAALEMGPAWMARMANYAPSITIFFLCFDQIGTCCVYIIFIANNIKHVVDHYVSEPIIITHYILVIFIPCFLIFMVPNMKVLVKFTLFGNIIFFSTLGTVFYYVFQKDLPNFLDRTTFGERPMDYALFFGTVMFGCQSLGVVLEIEMNMATPKSFTKSIGVLNIGMIIITLVNTLFGIVGYWKYGEETHSSITINFPIKEILAQVIILSYAFSIYISYGLQGYVPVLILWHEYIADRIGEISEIKKIGYEYLLRTAIVVITFGFAIAVPMLGLFISLIGCFALPALSVLFPAILDLCSHWPEEAHLKTFRFWKDMFIIFIAWFTLLCGTYSTVYEIADQLASGE